MKKTLFMILSGLVILAALGGIFFYMQMDSIAQQAIEKYASAIVGTQVTVGNVAIAPTSGEGTVTLLKIRNPAGFANDYAFSMNSTEVIVDPQSLPTEVVVIDQIVMDDPDITYEVNAHGNNFGILRVNTNDYLTKGESHATEGMIASKQVIIKEFYLRNGKVKVIAPSLQNQSFIVSLPTIHLSNLGKDQGKGNLPQIMQQIVTIITNSVVSAVGNVTLQNFVTFLPNTAADVAGGTVKETGTVVEDIGQGIGKVFNGGK